MVPPQNRGKGRENFLRLRNLDKIELVQLFTSGYLRLWIKPDNSGNTATMIYYSNGEGCVRFNMGLANILFY